VTLPLKNAVNPEPAAVEVQTEEALPEEVLPAELPAEPTVAAAAAAVETPTHVEVVAPPEPEPAPPPRLLRKQLNSLPHRRK